VTRLRYDRGSWDSAVRAAERAVDMDGRPRFVFGTALGFTVANCPPPFGQQHVEVNGKSGRVFHAFGFAEHVKRVHGADVRAQG
jgi:hypothetical protein